MLAELLDQYTTSDDEDRRFEIINQISLLDGWDPINSLMTIILSDDNEDDERAYGIECLRGNPLADEDEIFNKIMSLLKITNVDEIKLWSSIYIGLYGIEKENRRKELMDYVCSTNNFDESIETILTEVGIRGKGLFTNDQISEIENIHGSDSVGFIKREWSRQ